MRLNTSATRRRLGTGGWRRDAALAVIATCTRLAYWLATSDRPLESDASQYHELAVNLARGHGFAMIFPQLDIHPTAFRPPVFPILLGGAQWLFGTEPGVARASAVLIGVVLVVVVHRVARHQLDEGTATVAAGLVAVFPPLIANDTVPLTESLSLIMLVILADLAARERWMLVGAVAGLLVLTRPSAQGLVLLAVVWAFAVAGWRRALTVAAVVGLVVAPWIVRNRVAVGATEVVTSNGFNMAAIYSVEAQRVGAFVDPVHSSGFDDMRLAQFDEAAWDRELRGRALRDLRSNPTYVARVVGRNALSILEVKPSFNENAEEADGRHLGVRSWSLPLFYAVAVLGVIGCWRSRRSSRFVLFLSVSAGYFIVTSLFFVAPPRLRAPFDLAVCVGAAVVVTPLIRAHLGRWRARDLAAPGRTSLAAPKRRTARARVLSEIPPSAHQEHR